MARIEEDRRYTNDHEWALVDPDDDQVVIVGVTDYAQEHLGDIVMVELPEVGEEIQQGEAFGSVESPKSVSDLFAPVSGEVIDVNAQLEDTPETVNADCYGEGWLVKVRMGRPEDLEDLMDAPAYAAYLETLEEA